MRFAARCIATMAVAFAMVPALYADDAAKPAAEATKNEPAASMIAPTVAAKTQPNTAETVPVRYSTNRRSLSGANALPAGAMHHWDESGNYTPKVEWFLGYSFWRAMPTAMGTVWATCMAEAPPSHTTSTGMSDSWRISAAMTTAG